MIDPTKPNNDLPKLPPAAKLETERVLKALVQSRASLAALKEAGSSLPDRSVILHSMVLQEAKLSTEIEHIVTTHDELYRQIDNEEALQSPEVREVRRYRHALWDGYEKLVKNRKVDTTLALGLASQILERKISLRDKPGTVLGDPRTGSVVYTPPEGEDIIRDLLSNLFEFVGQRSEIDPLVRVAAAHYQFEAIHPFADANGRTGRVLNILFMVHLGLLDLPVLYLSQEFLASRSEYYSKIRGVTERGEWEEWIKYFLECVDITAVVTRRQFGLIQRAIRDAELRARSELPRWFPARMIDLIFTKPYTRISDVVGNGIARRETAAKHLRALQSIGLLEERRAGKEVLFLNAELLDILSLRS